VNAYEVKADVVNVAVRRKFPKCGRISRPALVNFRAHYKIVLLYFYFTFFVFEFKNQDDCVWKNYLMISFFPLNYLPFFFLTFISLWCIIVAIHTRVHIIVGCQL